MSRLLAAALAACALAAAGCGGSDSEPSEPVQAVPEGAPEAFEALRDCLTDQGVELPEGGDPGAGAPPELSDEQQQAFERCRGELQ